MVLQTRSQSEGLGAGQQEVEADVMAKKRLISAIHMSALTGDPYFNGVIERLYSSVNPMDAGTPNGGHEATMAFDMLYYARLRTTPPAFASRIKRDYETQLIGGYNGWLGAENSVTQFYHAWFKDGSQWDEVGRSRIGPAPGFLVGGPNPGYERDQCCATGCPGEGARMCRLPIKSPPSGQPPAKSYADFNEGWPINSWAVTENSNSYQIAYIRLLCKAKNSYKVFFIYIFVAVY